MSRDILKRCPVDLVGRNGLVDRYFYFAMALLIAFITVYGFHFTIDQNLLHPSIPRPILLWIHASAFSIWLALFIVQSALVRIHRADWHRTLGWTGLALGSVLPILGTGTTIVMDRFHIRWYHESPSDWANFCILQFNDMLLFAIFFALAAFLRRKPQLHRRLMLIATCGLTTAAFGRFPSVAIQNDYFYLCVDALILLGVFRDLLIDRRIHRVYLYALPALALEQALVMFTYLNTLPWWTRIGRTILG